MPTVKFKHLIYRFVTEEQKTHSTHLHCEQAEMKTLKHSKIKSLLPQGFERDLRAIL